jgi:hypothetical protein
MCPVYRRLKRKELYETQEEFVKQVFKTRASKRNAGDSVGKALRAAPLISLFITVGKVTHRYEEPSSSQAEASSSDSGSQMVTRR